MTMITLQRRYHLLVDWKGANHPPFPKYAAVDFPSLRFSLESRACEQGADGQFVHQGATICQQRYPEPLRTVNCLPVLLPVPVLLCLEPLAPLAALERPMERLPLLNLEMARFGVFAPCDPAGPDEAPALGALFKVPPGSFLPPLARRRSVLFALSPVPAFDAARFGTLELGIELALDAAPSIAAVFSTLHHVLLCFLAKSWRQRTPNATACLDTNRPIPTGPRAGGASDSDPLCPQNQYKGPSIISLSSLLTSTSFPCRTRSSLPSPPYGSPHRPCFQHVRSPFIWHGMLAQRDSLKKCAVRK